MEDRGHLTTEQRHPDSIRLDRLSIDEAFDLFNRADATVASAVAAARNDICRAIELVTESLSSGGRLIYVGAGTSGRLGVLDATECPPTFHSDPAMVQGVIAGGLEALTRSIEGAEDDPAGGAAAIDQHEIGPGDVVFAIASGGTTPFVHGALQRAREVGAKTVFLSCVPRRQVADEADVSIRVITGPELLTGSTRMKAGTATKMVLNMVSTITMVRLGKVFGNLMVDVNTGGNQKLMERGARIVQTITGQSFDAARSLLEDAGGHVKTALTMRARQVDRATAERLLAEAGGRLCQVIDDRIAFEYRAGLHEPEEA